MTNDGEKSIKTIKGKNHRPGSQNKIFRANIPSKDHKCLRISLGDLTPVLIDCLFAKNVEPLSNRIKRYHHPKKHLIN